MADHARREQQYERIRKQRQELIREASIKHEIAGFHHVLDEEQMRDFTQRLDEMINAQVQKMETMKVRFKFAERSRFSVSTTHISVYVDSKMLELLMQNVWTPCKR